MKQSEVVRIVVFIIMLLQVWQAIEKVLLEDSMVAGTSEDPQLTELSPVAQLHLGETSSQLYCHNNSQSYDNCKVTLTNNHRARYFNFAFPQ